MYHNASILWHAESPQNTKSGHTFQTGHFTMWRLRGSYFQGSRLLIKDIDSIFTQLREKLKTSAGISIKAKTPAGTKTIHERRKSHVFEHGSINRNPHNIIMHI